jgi:hypothetical protein
MCAPDSLSTGWRSIAVFPTNHQIIALTKRYPPTISLCVHPESHGRLQNAFHMGGDDTPRCKLLLLRPRAKRLKSGVRLTVSTEPQWRREGWDHRDEGYAVPMGSQVTRPQNRGGRSEKHKGKARGAGGKPPAGSPRALASESGARIDALTGGRGWSLHLGTVCVNTGVGQAQAPADAVALVRLEEQLHPHHP